MPLNIHFLNVGRGDCTILEFPHGNRVGIIDMCNAKSFDKDTIDELRQEYYESIQYEVDKMLSPLSSLHEALFIANRAKDLTDPIAYIDTHIGRQTDIFRLLITHPDMDHMTGLHRLYYQEPKSILNFWHTGFENFNLDDTSNEDWEKSPYEKKDWETYKYLRNGLGTAKSLLKTRWDIGDFWTQDGIDIWSPTDRLLGLAKEKQQPNIQSMVLKIKYMGRSIVLSGDATSDETWPDIYENIDLSGIDILKASHHGRKSGYYWKAVKEMAPWLTITSVTEKAHDATNNYRRYSDYTVSLRNTKDIKITIADDGTIYYPKPIENHWNQKLGQNALSNEYYSSILNELLQQRN